MVTDTVTARPATRRIVVRTRSGTREPTIARQNIPAKSATATVMVRGGMKSGFISDYQLAYNVPKLTFDSVSDDHDCEGSLVCYHRDRFYKSVPGCSGGSSARSSEFNKVKFVSI